MPCSYGAIFTLGFDILIYKKTLIIDSNFCNNPVAPYDLVKTMRAGVLAMGPLLGKLNKCKVALSGGCALGVRPINFHLKGFSKMGAKYKLNKGYVNISARRGVK